MATIAVAATAPFGADVLERLAERHAVACLLTRPDAPRGRGRRTASPPAKEVAERLGIPVLQPEQLHAGLDLAAQTVVICAYGVLVPESLLAKRRWLNVHPSLLPRWRGAAPVERAIMAGDAVTGVTVHETVAALDAGPIAAQQAFPIGADDDAGVVFRHAAEVAVSLLDAVLAEPAPRFTPQSDEGVTYADKIDASDRELDERLSPEERVRRVRALSPHIGARTTMHGKPVTVWRARIAEDGSFEPLEVQPAGGRRMPVDAWRRGLR